LQRSPDSVIDPPLNPLQMLLWSSDVTLFTDGEPLAATELVRRTPSDFDISSASACHAHVAPGRVMPDTAVLRALEIIAIVCRIDYVGPDLMAMQASQLAQPFVCCASPALQERQLLDRHGIRVIETPIAR